MKNWLNRKILTVTLLFSSNVYAMPLNGAADCFALGDRAERAVDFLKQKELYESQAYCFSALKYSADPVGVTKTINGVQKEVTVNAEEEEKKALERAEESGAKASFLGLNLGYGFAILHYWDKVVDEAEVVNGVIVAESTKENEAKVVLEFHQLLWGIAEDGNSGYGPFASLLVGNEDVLDGVGLGVLYGARNQNEKDGAGFSIGLGFAIENSVKQLADGFEVGQPLPAGETEIRFEEKDEISPFLFISNNF